MTAPTSAAPAPSGVCSTSGGIDANGKSVGLGSDFPRALTCFSSGPHAEPDETEATSPRCSFTATRRACSCTRRRRSDSSLRNFRRRGRAVYASIYICAAANNIYRIVLSIHPHRHRRQKLRAVTRVTQGVRRAHAVDGRCTERARCSKRSLPLPVRGAAGGSRHSRRVEELLDLLGALRRRCAHLVRRLHDLVLLSLRDPL